VAKGVFSIGSGTIAVTTRAKRSGSKPRSSRSAVRLAVSAACSRSSCCTSAAPASSSGSIFTYCRLSRDPSGSSRYTRPPVRPAPRLKPTEPSTRATPPVMYWKAFASTPSTTTRGPSPSWLLPKRLPPRPAT